MTPNARYQAKYRERYVRRGGALEAILAEVSNATVITLNGPAVGYFADRLRDIAKRGLAKDSAGGEG